MKRIIYGIFTVALAVLLSACGNAGTDAAKDELKKNDDNKSEAKVNTSENEKSDKDEKESAESEDIWTYYNDATWSDEFNGLKIEVQKVVVTEKAPTLEDENAEESAIGVKFKVENTSERVFSTYPDQAVLVTSTGEQIDMPDMFLSDHIGGEIHEGVIKEGDVIWYLERGHALDVEWIKLEWNATDEEEEDYSKAYHTFSTKLDLK